MLLQQPQQLLFSSTIGVKPYFRLDIKPIQPDPLRPIMITKPMRGLDLRTIVRIIIVGHVERLVDLGESR